MKYKYGIPSIVGAAIVAVSTIIVYLTPRKDLEQGSEDRVEEIGWMMDWFYLYASGYYPLITLVGCVLFVCFSFWLDRIRNAGIDWKQIRECEVFIKRKIKTRPQARDWRCDVIDYLQSRGHNRTANRFAGRTTELKDGSGHIPKPVRRGKETIRMHIKENLKKP